MNVKQYVQFINNNWFPVAAVASAIISMCVLWGRVETQFGQLRADVDAIENVKPDVMQYQTDETRDDVHTIRQQIEKIQTDVASIQSDIASLRSQLYPKQQH